jgi:hypothetical protein
MVRIVGEAVSYIVMPAETPTQSVTKQMDQSRIFLLRHRILLVIVVLLIAAFAFWMTDTGQMMLRGTSPPGETPFEADDREMGAGLAPFAFALLPGLLVVLGTGIDIAVRYFRHNRESNRLKGSTE